MNNETDDNDDGLYDLINLSDGSDDNNSIDDNSNYSNNSNHLSPELFLSPRTKLLNHKAQVNFDTYIQKSVNGCNFYGMDLNKFFICSQCQTKNCVSLDWCIKCGEYLIKSKSEENESQSNVITHLDLSSLDSLHDDVVISRVDLDVDVIENDDIIRQCNRKIMYNVPKLDLSDIDNPTDLSASQLASPHFVQIDNEKENNVNKRYWETSSLSWDNLPTALLQKKPASKLYHRNKFGSFTNYPCDNIDDKCVIASHFGITENPIKCHEINSQSIIIQESSLNNNSNIYQSNVPNWHCLPTELWFNIMSYLCHVDIAKIQSVCRRLYQIGIDPRLWVCITLHKSHVLCDNHLITIANRRPRQLHFRNCVGTNVSIEGLKQMFSICGRGLESLSFISCSKGAMETDYLLRLAAQFCPNITHINASYLMHLQDCTLIELSGGLHHITHLSLMGANSISNSSISALVQQHNLTLTHIDLYGCFKLESSTLDLLQTCINLRSLALGSLKKLQRTSLIKLLSKLPHLLDLDLRGTMGLVDNKILNELCDLCPRLQSLILTHSSYVTSQGLHHIANSNVKFTLRILDICGCSKVNDSGIEMILRNCVALEDLDISCTGVSSRGKRIFENYPPPNLKCLRINNNRLISESDLLDIIRNCNKLRTIYLCGQSSVNNWSVLEQRYPHIIFKHD